MLKRLTYKSKHFVQNSPKIWFIPLNVLCKAAQAKGVNEFIA